jgi:fucose permease
MSLRAAATDPVKRHLLLTGFMSFILIGAQQAMYGPAFPALRESFGLGAGQVGLMVSAHFAGAIIGIIGGGLAMPRFGFRRSLVLSAVLLLLGALAVAIAPLWSLALSGALAIGLGFGGISIGMNVLVGLGFGARGAAALNLLNALYGLGAVLGPLLIALTLPNYRLPFLLSAVAAALLLVLLAKLAEPEAPSHSPDTSVSALWPLLGFVLLYFLYVGSEVGTGTWSTTHLADSLGPAGAAGVTALFWGALMVGRLLAVPISIRFSAPRVVIIAAMLGSAALALTHATPLAPLGYGLAGLFLAPIFPTGLAWLQQVYRAKAAQVSSIAIASANFGGVVIPPLIGLTIEATSTAIIPSLLTLSTLACLSVALIIRRGRG